MMKETSWMGWVSALILTIFFSNRAHAWGLIGHRTVTETAAMLLERESPPHAWGPFLSKHRFALGYYSVLADTLYRQEDGANGKIEGPTHYFDIDLALRRSGSKAVQQQPRNWNLISQKSGTSPWRVAQLFEMAKTRLAGVRSLAGDYQPGKTSTGSVKAVYEGMVLLGSLAHYTADATVPHHATSDYNGFSKRQGGIHFYFESDCVNQLAPGLGDDVLKLALNEQKNWLKQWNATDAAPMDIMWNVYLDSYQAISRVEKIDRDSAIKKLAPKGSQEFARRKPPAEGCRPFRALLIERMAKGAVLTADLWRRALPANTDFSAAQALILSDFEPSPTYIAPKYPEQMKLDSK